MPNFLNVAALLETTLEPADLKQALRSIEEDLGRVRLKDKYAARAIDLDLSLYGSQMVDDPHLVLPDPEILDHAHLAIPLAELDPAFMHPGEKEELEAIAGRMRRVAELRERADLTEQLAEITHDRTHR